MLEAYSSVLTQALRSIEDGNVQAAEWLLNNHYHHQRRSAAEFSILLQLTTHHRAYVSASDTTKNELARILFLLDPKKNRRDNTPIRVTARRDDTAAEGLQFYIEESKSAPAH